MNPSVPVFVSLIFIATTFLTLWLLCRATPYRRKVIVFSIGWIALQALITLSGFYQNFTAAPPRFLLLAGPAVLFIVILFLIKPGRRFIDSFNQEKLTWAHTVRVPVELVLFWLFIYKQIPEIMTFEGRNFDIVSGLTAPLIAVFGFRRKQISKPVIVIWNLICIALLFNIVATAILSTPIPIQKFGFDQPNVAIMFFPFSWLPCFVVPAVLFAHLVQLRKLVSGKQ